MRRGIWEKNVLEMIEFNIDPANTYKKGISWLSDRTEAELAGKIYKLFSIDDL